MFFWASESNFSGIFKVFTRKRLLYFSQQPKTTEIKKYKANSRLFKIQVFSIEMVNMLNILKLSCRQLTFASDKTFLKNKKRSRTSLATSYSAWLLKKNISLVLFYYLTKFLAGFALWDIGLYVYCNCLLTRLPCYKF